MVARRLLLLCVLILLGYTVGAAATAAYYWQKATALPSWHGRGLAGSSLADALSPSPTSILSSKLGASDRIQPADGDRVEVVLSEGDLNHLMVEALTQIPQAAGLLQATQSTSATIEGDRIRGGVVINPSVLSTQALPGRAQQALDQAFRLMPMLADRPFYLGFEGTPRVEQGRLVLDQDTRVQVGRMNLTLSDVSHLTGLSLDQMVAETGLTLEDVELVDGQAILSGSMASPAP
jgi:hypothetical protein